MADLLTDQDTAAFIKAMRDVSDTFQKYPVTFGDGGESVSVLCGRKSIKNELLAREDGTRIEAAYKLSLNRQHATEKGLIDDDDELLIGYDTPVWIDGERFAIIRLDEPAVFREKKLNIVMEVVS
ncbi:MAG: hypothetical protein MI862_26660 [Desulfobacterales bacterium]|nr:hypothetical protein [Desulfobacterales bacterium]